MKFKKGSKFKKGGNSSLSRKQQRKEQRQEKKFKRAAEYNLHWNNKKGGKGNASPKENENQRPNKIQQLQAFIEAEKAKMKMNKGGKGSPGKKTKNKRQPNEQGKKNANKRKKGENTEEQGFQMSSATSERMARLQEFVNQEARKMGTQNEDTAKVKKKGDVTSGQDGDGQSDTKKNKKMKKLKEAIDESDREIKKYEKLLKINKKSSKNMTSQFGADISSLLEDIDSGEIKQDTDIANPESNADEEDDLLRDMAIALGEKPKKKKQKESQLKGRALPVDYENGDIDDDDDYEKYDDYEGLGEDDFNDFENGNDMDSDEEDNGEIDYGDYEENSDDEHEDVDNYTMGRKVGKDFDGEVENEEDMFSADGEWSSDDGGVDEIQPRIDFGRLSRDREDDFDGEEREVDSEGEEEEEEDDGFLDDEAEEGSEEESDDDGKELVHDIRKEEEYAFEGGCSYYTKPEILKNGQENDIDRYSSNSEDDTDLEDFVVDDDDVEYENVDDELPVEEFDDSDDEQGSDALSPVKKRKKKRLVVDSEEESEDEDKKPDDDDDDADSVDDVNLNGKPNVKLSTRSPRLIISDDECDGNEEGESEHENEEGDSEHENEEGDGEHENEEGDGEHENEEGDSEHENEEGDNEQDENEEGDSEHDENEEENGGPENEEEDGECEEEMVQSKKKVLPLPSVSSADSDMEEVQPKSKKCKKKMKGKEDMREDKTGNKRKRSGETSDTTEEEEVTAKKQKIRSKTNDLEEKESNEDVKTVKTILKKTASKKLKKKGKLKEQEKRRVSFDLPDVTDDDDESEDELGMNAEFSPDENSLNEEDDCNDESAGSAEFSSDDEEGEGKTDVEKSKVNGHTGDDNLTEDIYGRLRDKEGNVVTNKDESKDGKYVPPAVRKLMALQTDEKKKEQLVRVKRTLKGLFNRLAESNLGGIANQIEGLFANISRNDMCDIVTEILFESLIGPSLTPERLVQEHAVLVAVLSANIGEEIGAHVLNEFVLRWSDGMKEVSGSPDQSKELDNMLLFIANLYNFKIVDATLVYGILEELADSFGEKEVELILLLLRNVGFTLRRDNPLALKSFIVKIQDKAAEAEAENAESDSYSRIRFMLEIIQAIRNNHMAKVPNYDPTHVEHLKKLMKGLVNKGNQNAAPLKVTLGDLLKSRECGRWWIVGSAFSGGLIEEKPLERKQDIRVPNLPMDGEFSENFRQRAAKLQLSRPPRINILYIITEGSEDYLDAFDKLINLNLPNQQERELFNVILLCAQKGKQYNPFFAYLSTKLCKYDRKYKRLLQFALWDKFQDLENMKERELANLAKFVSHLIGEDGLNLSLFKTISFMEVEGQTVSFIRQILIAILLHRAGANTVENIFSKLHLSPKLRMLRQSLRVFIKKFLSTKKNVDDENHKLLSKRIEIAMEILSKGVGVCL